MTSLHIFEYLQPTYSYSQVAEYGRLAGPRPVKTFVMNMTSQNWLTGCHLSKLISQ